METIRNEKCIFTSNIQKNSEGTRMMLMYERKKVSYRYASTKTVS